MTEWLLRLASLSAGGALAILLLLAIERLAGLRYAAKWRCLAWLLLCLRLAVPFSVLQTRERATAPIRVEVPANVVIYQPAAPTVQPSPPSPQTPPTVPAQPREQATTEPAPQKRPVTLSEALLAVWALGALGVIGWAALGHIRFLRYVRRWSAGAGERETRVCGELKELLGLRCAPRLLTCQGLQTPMLAGLLRPCLLLPEESMEETPLRHALLHELTHYKRRDILFKLLVLWVCALHWFNPAVWLMRRAVERDLELACDDAALRVLPESERAAYGQTILSAAERRQQA